MRLGKVESLRSDDAIGGDLIAYQIRNTITNRKYIGVTTNFTQRVDAHFSLLKYNKHWVADLQSDYNNLGGHVFVSEVVYKIPYIDSDQKKFIERIYMMTATNLYNKNVYEHKFEKRSLSVKEPITFRINGKKMITNKKTVHRVLNNIFKSNQYVLIFSEGMVNLNLIRRAFILYFSSSTVNTGDIKLRTKTENRHTSVECLRVSLVKKPVNSK